jgi:myosin-1
LNSNNFLIFRDAIAKALYSKLFMWLVEKVNNIICKYGDKKNSIAILDIFGFEVFERNLLFGFFKF